jgi:transposase
MARRSFDVFDLIELLTHWHAGRSQRQLAESLGIDRKTIAKYLAPAIAESWISANLAEEVTREKVTVARGPVPPGSEAQIDYGRLGMWFDPVSGRRVAVWAFVMVLAHSRYLFVQPVIRMDQSSWCASHVAAFEFFGGVPEFFKVDESSGC